MAKGERHIGTCPECGNEQVLILAVGVCKTCWRTSGPEKVAAHKAERKANRTAAAVSKRVAVTAARARVKRIHVDNQRAYAEAQRVASSNPMTKVCSVCRSGKSISEFGAGRICKSCESRRNLAHYVTNLHSKQTRRR